MFYRIEFYRLCRRRRIAMSMTALLLSPPAWASNAAIQPGVYEITTQTVMPHLDENLRYATTQKLRCVRGDDLSSLFSLLQHPSLDGCKLGDKRHGNTIRYLLVCESPNETTGIAQLEGVSQGHITGRLDIRMGGKNMTFGQRIKAKRQGECD